MCGNVHRNAIFACVHWSCIMLMAPRDCMWRRGFRLIHFDEWILFVNHEETERNGLGKQSIWEWMEARHYFVHAKVLHFLFPQWESASLALWWWRCAVKGECRSIMIAIISQRVNLRFRIVCERNWKSRRWKRKKQSIHANDFIVCYCDGCDDDDDCDNDYGGFALCFCFRIKCLCCARFIKFSVFLRISSSTI